MEQRTHSGKAPLWCLAASAVCLVLCSKSSPLFALNDWMDANIFFTMGKSMMHGLVLYRDVFDHKGPVLYLLYGLGSLVDGTGFAGVLLLEIAALTIALWLSLATVKRLAGAVHPAWVFVPAVALTTARAFAHGGSAEEFCLPLLAAALYALVRTLTGEHPMPLRQVVLQGALAGCALWLKYTVLGFYLAWVAVLAVCYLRKRRARALWQSALAYLAGMVLVTLPWLVYFGVNGAVGDWFTAYFYDNIALYSGNVGNPALHLLRCLWWAVRDNPACALLAAIGVFACRYHKKCGVAAAVAALAFGLALTSFTGNYLVYYGLVLAVFAPLGLCAVPPVAARCPAGLKKAVPALALLAVPACLLFSHNAPLRGRTPAGLPQYCFAAEIRPGASLLNYGALDGGFYTTTGALPPCRSFCITNMPLPAQWDTQRALLADAAVDYIVTPDGGLDEQYPAYTLRDSAAYDGGEGEITWYLYEKS